MAAIIGFGAGVSGWLYWTTTDTTIATPTSRPASIAPAMAASAPAEPIPASAPILSAPVRAPDPAPARAKVAAPVQADVDDAEEDQIGGFAPVTYFGTLSIDAAPGGDVFVDRKAVGRTPLRVNNLRAGSHLIWVERDGYRRWTRVVQVPANRVSRVSADLEPIASR